MEATWKHQEIFKRQTCASCFKINNDDLTRPCRENTLRSILSTHRVLCWSSGISCETRTKKENVLRPNLDHSRPLLRMFHHLPKGAHGHNFLAPSHLEKCRDVQRSKYIKIPKIDLAPSWLIHMRDSHNLTAPNWHRRITSNFTAIERSSPMSSSPKTHGASDSSEGVMLRVNKELHEIRYLCPKKVNPLVVS